MSVLITLLHFCVLSLRLIALANFSNISVLTYMSIAGQIRTLGPGKLRPFVPRSRHKPRRRLFLSEQAQKDFDDPHSAVNILVGKGFIEASMTRWVLGERIYGTSKRGTFLDRLSSPPPEVWEIRVTEPSSQARLFGRFAEQDTLILTRFHTRSFLGDKGSQAWKNAMAECVAIWDTLFPGLAPYSGLTIHHYVSEQCDTFPLY
jgi:hypothetical protein